MPKNIFGEELIPCCYEPVTGFYRDGLCRTDTLDNGRHVVCAIMTDEFLEFSRSKGNDLIKPIPEFNFPGLKAGNKWCLCVYRWKEAFNSGVAPKVILEATAEEALQHVDIFDLMKHAHKSKD